MGRWSPMKKNVIIRLKKAGLRVKRYINHDLFCIDIRKMPKIKAGGFQALKLFVLSSKKFFVDQCQLRASALTFYSLLSIVPVVAMAFGIAKGFGLERRLEQDLYLRFPGQHEALTFIIEFAHSFLDNTKGGLVAGIGVLVLLLSVVKVLDHIERAFNLIWGVKSRTFDRKFSDYLAIMLTAPLLFIIASSLTVFIRTQVEFFTANVAILSFLSPFILLLLKLLPYVLIWILFTMVYLIMPNIRVRIGSAFLAGTVAGTLYQLSQIAYINFQIFVANYNAIYGSFAALPLFMIWLQVSWLILLLGAEISNTHHTDDSYGYTSDTKKVSHHYKKLIALQVLHYLVKRFENCDPPIPARDVAHELKLPFRLVQEVTTVLAETGLISLTVLSHRNTPGLQPGRAIPTLSIQSVILAMDRYGNPDFDLAKSPIQTKIDQSLNKLTKENQQSKNNHLLKDI